MNSEKKLDQAMEEMRKAGEKDLLLFSADGELISGDEDKKELGESVSMFVDSPAESQIEGGWAYFRVEMNGETEYVLLCSADDETEHSFAIGRMALCHIRDLMISSQEPENRSTAIRQMLNGEISEVRTAELCHQLHIEPSTCILYVIQYKRDPDSILFETLRNLFSNSLTDYLIEMDGNRTVLIKDVNELSGLTFKHYAETIVDNLQSEAMANVWIGYGSPIDSFEQAATAYKNACTALEIGMVFYAEERVFFYQELGIGRLIYKLPPDLCEMFLEEVLGENKEIDLDDETMVTIRKLFENNLNISETARQLYIHRNTLVYRLERIEKRLGMDIRTFEDAMTFKIAMMVRQHLNELHIEK